MSITLERLVELFELDAETGVLIWKAKSHKNSPVKAGDVAGCPDDQGYLSVRVDGSPLKVHRVVFAMAHGYFPEQVDHVNGVRDDNRLANLRAATNSQNSRNSRISSNNTSGVKGVYWHKAAGKWMAQIQINRRHHYIGLFADIKDAAAAARAAREQHHEEFARHV